MKIFMAHNYYQKSGGEDRSFHAEADILESKGHYVYRYTKNNDAINQMSKFDLARKTIWNRSTYDELKKLFAEKEFDVAHFQNTFPLISPAAYDAAKDANIPVIQTLRNYRLICPNAIFFRDGHVCEDCLGKSIAYPGILHKCYRGSRLQTAGVVALQVTSRVLKTWDKKIDCYITMTNFTRDKYIEAGFPANKIVIKPNFLAEDVVLGEDQGYCLYVGRLTQEKGVFTMLEAWQSLDIPLKIVGTGVAIEDMQNFIDQHNLNVELLGHQPPDVTLEYMKHARLLVLPSEWYETFGRVAVEAFAYGVPVVASNIGAVADVVSDNINGLHFMTGNPSDLKDKILKIYTNTNFLSELKLSARKTYETLYTPAKNYDMLINIYENVI